MADSKQAKLPLSLCSFLVCPKLPPDHECYSTFVNEVCTLLGATGFEVIEPVCKPIKQCSFVEKFMQDKKPSVKNKLVVVIDCTDDKKSAPPGAEEYSVWYFPAWEIKILDVKHALRKRCDDLFKKFLVPKASELLCPCIRDDFMRVLKKHKCGDSLPNKAFAALVKIRDEQVCAAARTNTPSPIIQAKKKSEVLDEDDLADSDRKRKSSGTSSVSTSAIPFIFKPSPPVEEIVAYSEVTPITIGEMQKAFEKNCIQATNVLQMKKPTIAVTCLTELNKIISQALVKAEFDANLRKVLVVVLIYHANVTRIIMTIGGQKVEPQRSERHPLFFKVIEKALKTKQKISPHDVVSLFLEEVLTNMTEGVLKGSYEPFLKSAYVKLHRVALIIGLVYLSHQLAKCGNSRAMTCTDVVFSDANALLHMTKSCLGATFVTIGEKMADVFNAYSKQLFNNHTEMRNYKLVYVSFQLNFSMLV